MRNILPRQAPATFLRCLALLKPRAEEQFGVLASEPEHLRRHVAVMTVEHLYIEPQITRISSMGDPFAKLVLESVCRDSSLKSIIFA